MKLLKLTKKYLKMFIIIFSLGCLLSCGLEEFYFLDSIPDGNVTYIDTTGTNIRLSSSSYFENFVIFYRIYISETNISGQIVTAEQRTSINPALNSDFNAIFPWTDKTSTTVNTANLENSFLARRYYQLTLQGSNINGVLGSNSLGRTLEIRFSSIPRESPVLSLDNMTPPYPFLQRANSAPGMNFRPLPEDRLFFNHADLRNSNYATAEINADVASHSSANPLYAYASMYIAATGRTLDLPPRTIFSQPTFIGIFRLTENP
jgi:hypothetical protein